MSTKNKLLGFFKKFSDKKQPQRQAVKQSEKDLKKREEKLSSAKSLAKAVSQEVGIYYENKNGEVEKRKVTIRRIWQRGQEIMVDGFCHEVKAPRIFLASRIQKIVDLKKKKVYAQPKKFLLGEIAAVPSSGSMGVSSTSQIIAKLRNELAALVFLAKVDDEFNPSEMKVIMEYTKSRSGNLKYNFEELRDHLERLVPDEECFYEAMDEILNQPIDIITAFVESFVKLILSDGVVHDDEREFLGELLQILREEGIELDVGF